MVSNSSGAFLYIFELFAAGEPGGNGPGRTEVLTEPGRDAAGIRCQEGREQEDQHRQHSAFQPPAVRLPHYHVEGRRHPAFLNCMEAHPSPRMFSQLYTFQKEKDGGSAGKGETLQMDSNISCYFADILSIFDKKRRFSQICTPLAWTDG